MANALPKLWEKVKKHLEVAEHGKTLSARQNNCSKAIALLREMNRFGSRGKVARKTDDLLAKLTALEKTLPIDGKAVPARARDVPAPDRETGAFEGTRIRRLEVDHGLSGGPQGFR